MIDKRETDEELRGLVDHEQFSSIVEQSYLAAGSPKDQVSAARTWNGILQELKPKPVAWHHRHKLLVGVMAAVMIAVLGTWQIRFNPQPETEGLKGLAEIPVVADLAVFIDGVYWTTRDVFASPSAIVEIEIETPRSGLTWLVQKFDGDEGFYSLGDSPVREGATQTTRIRVHPTQMARPSRICALRSEGEKFSTLQNRLISTWNVLAQNGCVHLTIQQESRH